MSKEPNTIKECKEMIKNKEIPRISKIEKENLIKTFKQQRGEITMKKVEDLTNEELLKFELDCKDTLKYVEENKQSYGAMYDIAIGTTLSIKVQIENEKKKRGI